MNKAAIHVRNLSVRAGRRSILSVSDLSIEQNECVGILGANGSGKSTLLRTCNGMQHHVTGRVSVLGLQLASMSFRRLAALRRAIGYVPQLLPARGEIPLTLREVIAIGRTGMAGLLRPLGREDWHRVDQWIDRLGLSSLAGQGYGTVSGGEQRKTLIAKAMVQEPRILLLDEPTANLDPGWRERIVEIIQSLHATGSLTVVLVCHELEVLPPCCRRVVILDQGEVVADGSPELVLTGSRIESVYGPGLSVWHQGGRHVVVPAEVSRA
ncbi:MAG TPA: ABC transporter ATP-binding protein [Phycisphaerae bacterium]|nr:ABC transporter ATP-binding protein [Phycisphaerae bacterium]HRY67145.1 ABC transporter ATP-binding protein [Phycisphaerae bacterium]HSA26486.1 ABC transporter ATP-binding protein [Phycisphaerae bacterium]